MAYGLPLKDNGDEKCLSVLHAVEETVARQLKACKALSSKKRVSEGTDHAFVTMSAIINFFNTCGILAMSMQ